MKSALRFLILPVILCGCSQESAEEKKIGGANIYYESSGNGSAESGSSTSAGIEPEGPQYQTPNIDVLRGKRQLYPAKYPLKRYPGSKVEIVDVRQNRGPGFKNHVMLASSDRMEKISGFYQSQLTNDSWKKIREYKNENFESSTWAKGDIECEVRVVYDFTAPAGSQKKLVQLLYGKKAKFGS